MQVFRNRGWVVTAVATMVVLLGVAGVMISRAFAAAPSVVTATAESKTLSVTVSVSGKTEADVKRDVFPQAPGTLASIAVTDGQEVRAGQPLATLDSEQLDAAVEAAESACAQAAAQVDAVDSTAPSSADRAAAKAQVLAARRAYDRASAALVAAQAAVESTTGVARTQAAAGAESAASAKEQSYAAYLSANAALARLQVSTSAARESAQTAARAAEAALARARRSRDMSVLTAPIDGVVIFNPVGAPSADGSAPKVTVGAAVAPGAAPFTIVDMGSLRFTAQLDESDVPRVKPDSPAVVELDATPGREYRTKVVCVSPTASLTSNGGNAFPASMRLDNADQALRIGMGGSATLSVADVQDAIAVPIEALLEDKDGQSVLVVVDGQLVRREVTIGVMTESEVQIAKGLRAGEIVALSLGAPLEAGMRVETGGAR